MKKFYLLLLIVLSFFGYSERVDAAQELTCIYKGGLQSSSTMLVQTSEGKFFVYTNTKNKPSIDDDGWDSIDDNAEKVDYEWDSKFYSNGTLTSCPSYTRNKMKTNTEGVQYTFYFYEEKTFWHLDYKLLKKHPYIPDRGNFTQDFTSDDDYSQEISDTRWIGTCNYEDVILYFNREKLILKNKNSLIYSSSAGFSLNDLLEYYDQTRVCPTRLYQKVDQTVVSVGNTFQYVTYFLNNKDNLYEEKFIEEGSSINDDTPVETPPDLEIDECGDLFSDEFLGEINFYLMVVRIAVPIILVGMCVVDITKAIFAGEDEMKKVQTRLVKRFIAAILVFLMPTVLNFLLQIANHIWTVIDPNSCNIG